VLITTPARLRSDWPQRLPQKALEQLLRQIDAAGNPQLNTSEGNTLMATLYQTKEETPRFGTKLAVNSAGKYVLEMKGTGEVLAFAPADVEVVMPYTVRVRMSGGKTGGEYDFFSVPGALKKGDCVGTVGYGIVVVTAVDTKSSRATKPLRGRKLVSEPLPEPDAHTLVPDEDIDL
jgi:hypothetical protein